MAQTHNIAQRWARSRRAPLWISLSLLALAHADEDGESTWERGQIRRRFEVTTADVSRAITRAVAAGWLDPRSTSYRLVVRRGA